MFFVRGYKNFKGISQFPEFDFQTKFALIATADFQEFEYETVTAYFDAYVVLKCYLYSAVIF